MAENILRVILEDGAGAGLSSGTTGTGQSGGESGELGTLMGELSGILSTLVSGLIETLVSILGSLPGLLAAAFLGVLIALGVGAAMKMMEGINVGLENILSVIGTVGKLIGLLVRPFVDLFIPVFLLLAYILMPWVKIMNVLLTPVLILLMSMIKEFLPDMMKNADETIALLQNIGTWIGELLSAVMKGDWSEVWDLIFGAGKELAGSVIEAILEAVPYISEALSSIWEGIKDIKIGDMTIENWAEDIKIKLQSAWDFISEVFGGEGEDNPIISFFKDPISWITGTGIPALSTVASILLEALSLVFEFFKDNFTENVMRAVEAILDVLKLTIDIFKEDVIIGFAEFFIKIFKMAQNAINDIISEYNSTVGKIAGHKIDKVGFDQVSALQDVSRSASARKTELLESKKEIINNITIQGDVSGEEMERKIADVFERRSNELLGENGVFSS